MKKICLSFFIFCCFCTIGCSSSSRNGVQNGSVDAVALKDPRILIEDEGIQKWLRFERINSVLRQDGFLEFEAQFSNTSNYGKRLAYKVEWRDENGFTIKTILSRWITADVEGRRKLIVRGISPNIKARDFLLIVDRPNYYDNLQKSPYNKEHRN